MPHAIFYFYAFLLGSVTGSFLNVCIHRLPRGFHLHTPPSHCPFCNEPIRWYDNVPILSYLLLGRRCRFCGIRISPRYALVETLTGLLYVYLAYRLVGEPPIDFARLGIYTAVATALVAASFIDIEFRIIPDEISVPGTWLAPLVSFAWPDPYAIQDKLIVGPLAGLLGFTDPTHSHVVGLLASLLGMAAGAGVIWALGVVGRALFKKEAMGFGDVKLMAFVGGILGWDRALLTIVLGAVFGAIVGLLSLLRSRDTRIPFGPYLSLGGLVAMLHARDLAALLDVFVL